MLRELAMRCRDPTASCFDLRSERLDFCFPGFFSAPLWFQHAPDFLHPRFHRGLLATTAFSTRLPPFLVHCTRTADCLYIPFFFFSSLRIFWMATFVLFPLDFNYDRSNSPGSTAKCLASFAPVYI